MRTNGEDSRESLPLLGGGSRYQLLHCRVSRKQSRKPVRREQDLEVVTFGHCTEVFRRRNDILGKG